MIGSSAVVGGGGHQLNGNTGSEEKGIYGRVYCSLGNVYGATLYFDSC